MGYSQYDEEDFILTFFENKKGTLVDIGAADGITNSNTRKLIENGWEGLLVEPTPVNYGKLIDLYSNNKLINIENCGCGDATKESTFYIDNNDSYHQISTFLEEQKKSCENYFHCTFEEIKMKIYKTSDLFNIYKINNIDFISIDTEGYDEKVLLGIDFNKIKINLICVENISNVGVELLHSNDFELIGKSIGNKFYKKK
jgi:FkbM family methyltransferase